LLDIAEYSAFDATLYSAIVSYRIVTAAGFKGPISSWISVDLLLKGRRGRKGDGKGSKFEKNDLLSSYGWLRLRGRSDTFTSYTYSVGMPIIQYGTA